MENSDQINHGGASNKQAKDYRGRPIKGWEVKGYEDAAETLPADPQEAVERAFRAGEHEQVDPSDAPTSVTVVGYVPMALPSEQRMADFMLTHLYEWLGEEYGPDPSIGDEEMQANQADPAIWDKARELVAMVGEQYPVWPCEPSEVEIEVDPREYLEE
ncbi:hypothetical protein SAMN05660831_02056 [Thiohalospira halophila DSM 15071]|uniref:Uncharacterized protein n=1 Tax=Thiohalospira halophila DSM 15071 TaxID=1123397 RepID=A0A1I1U7J0_9GAMM|nr:hypothetical protein [Thiohalospira halophila]SFD66747.1 hypothetical protein SAMN05660831_02056 [Thiohalospira halophila DSM 15071]